MGIKTFNPSLIMRSPVSSEVGHPSPFRVSQRLDWREVQALSEIYLHVAQLI
jgi:hypothetical protein